MSLKEKCLNTLDPDGSNTWQRIEWLARNQARFWEKVDKNGPGREDLGSNCWIWGGWRSPSGYGSFPVKRRSRRVHRVSYELANGSIPDGVYVLHHCDNKACVNPSHLFLGSVQDNSDDMVKKGRSAKGERHGSAKLSRCDVSTIRTMCGRGASQRHVAKIFGVSQSTVAEIARRAIWRHLP